MILVSVCLSSVALSLRLSSYLGFSYFGRGFLLLLDVVSLTSWLLQKRAAAAPDLIHGVAPLGRFLFLHCVGAMPYTVKVTNRFKWLDLVDRLPENYRERFIMLYRTQWPKPSQRIRNERRQSCFLRRLYKYLRKEEKWEEKIYTTEYRLPKNSKEI